MGHDEPASSQPPGRDGGLRRPAPGASITLLATARQRPDAPARTGEVSGHQPPARAETNLPPALLTSFIGRGREMAEVAHLLTTSRLLTLTGAGGVGKTRLALAVAVGAREAYPDGVWLVELATLTDPLLVPRAVAVVLDVHERRGRSLVETLAATLAARRLLLVLDNCEHLVAACAALAEALLRACPQVRILATSRERLGLGGEVPWRVPSLGLPMPAAGGPWRNWRPPTRSGYSSSGPGRLCPASR